MLGSTTGDASGGVSNESTQSGRAGGALNGEAGVYRGGKITTQTPFTNMPVGMLLPILDPGIGFGEVEGMHL